MDTLVEIDNVRKVYKRDAFEVPVLNGVTLAVPRGDFLALMGPSGSGKTTLLNLIAGIDRPTGGRISVDGKEISRFSETQLASWRAAPRRLHFPDVQPHPGAQRLRERRAAAVVDEAVEEGAPRARPGRARDRRSRRPERSTTRASSPGGQEQRVAIARAIVTDPTLLVADEPTGDLDAKNAEETLDLLQRLNADFQKTIVMVTHDPKAALHAKRTLHLEKGLLVESGYGVETAANA